MKKHIAILSGLMIGFMASIAQAGKLIEFSIEQGGQTFNQTAKVSDNIVYFTALHGDANRDALFDNSRQALYIITHNTKSYFKIDQETIDQVSSTVDALAQMAEQNGLGDLLAQAGLGGGAKETTTKQVDKRLTVANIECDVLQTLVNNEPQSELCIAGQSSLKTALGAEYNTLNGLFAFSENLAQRAGKILSGLGLNVATFSAQGVEGLPIAAYSFVDQSQSKLVSISDEDILPTELALPVNYEQKNIPFIAQ